MITRTLLEEALANRKRRGSRRSKRIVNLDEITLDEIDLAIGWAKGLVGQADVAKALNTKVPHGVFSFLACALRAALQRGILLEEVEP